MEAWTFETLFQQASFTLINIVYFILMFFWFKDKSLIKNSIKKLWRMLNKKSN